MKLIILDRDGVINYDSDEYIKSPAEWIPIPGSLEAIADLNRAGIKVAVATNQSGIGRGYFDIHTLINIIAKMEATLANVGGHFDAIFFCPHKPEDNCQCRKPQPGLLIQIGEYFKADLTQAIMVGDSLRDAKAAMSVGVKPIFVGNDPVAGQFALMNNIPVFPDLTAFVKNYLQH